MGMRIAIEYMNARNIRYVGNCDGEFLIDARLVSLHLSGGLSPQGVRLVDARLLHSMYRVIA